MIFNILQVEDDPNDVLLVERAFRKVEKPPNITVVNNGEEAIGYLAGNGIYSDRERYPMPRLILLDVKLPLRSGFEVLAWIRQQPHTKRLPVVIFSSSQQSKDVLKAYDLTANSYLVKPNEFGDLVRLVDTLSCYWGEYNRCAA